MIPTKKTKYRKLRKGVSLTDITIRNDTVEIVGYVNAVERLSKPLWSRNGKFTEKVMSGCFGRAIERNDDIKILLNHDWNKELGTTKNGSLELVEDTIGLRAKAIITDSETVEKAKNGDLVGWSFGFRDIEVENGIDNDSGLPMRNLKDIELYEVSILDRTKIPAYNGTLVQCRDSEEPLNISEENNETVNTIDATTEETREEPEVQTKVLSEDYFAQYKNIISEMREKMKKVEEFSSAEH